MKEPRPPIILWRGHFMRTREDGAHWAQSIRAVFRQENQEDNQVFVEQLEWDAMDVESWRPVSRDDECVALCRAVRQLTQQVEPAMLGCNPETPSEYHGKSLLEIAKMTHFPIYPPAEDGAPTTPPLLDPLQSELARKALSQDTET